MTEFIVLNVFIPSLLSILAGIIANRFEKSKFQKIIFMVITFILVFVIIFYFKNILALKNVIPPNHEDTLQSEIKPEPVVPENEIKSKIRTIPDNFSGAIDQSKMNQFIKIIREDEVDKLYLVELKEGQGLTVALKPQINKGVMHLYLSDEKGSSLDSSKYISNGEYGTVNIKAAMDMTVYINVSGETGIYYIGFYDWYCNNASSMNDERDFFGDLMTAKRIKEGTSEKDDENYDNFYRVDIKEGQTITVNITPQINKGVMHLYLSDEKGSSLDSSKYINNGEYGTVTKKAATDGTFYIKISGSVGKYDLSYVIN